MRFYNQPHAAYCGVDLHARTMYLHILDDRGHTRFDQNLPWAMSTRLHPWHANLIIAIYTNRQLHWV
jgi:hypothetical protein